MKPIIFECSELIPRSALEISNDIVDVSGWSDFKGYLFLPGITKAEYELRTGAFTGSRIHVQNTDRSEHIEEILEWIPGKNIRMKLYGFGQPLSYLATHFIEEWSFEGLDEAALVTRKVQMFPKGLMTRPLLWLISLLLRRAIANHLKAMAKYE